MKKCVSYKVSWTSGGGAGESRRFDDWEPAEAFYAELVADRRCDLASLAEVTEAEVRCFEREAAPRVPEPAPAPGVPNRKLRKSRPKPAAGSGRTWMAQTSDAP